MRTQSYRIAIGCGTMLGVMAPGAAQAHLITTGMGPIYDGISHFGMSPEDFLPVIALAFFSGFRGPYCARMLLAILPVCWFAGGLAAIWGAAPPAVFLTSATALLFLAVGGMLASNIKLPVTLCCGVAALLGIVRGMSDVSGATANAAHVLSLIGMCASVAVVFALATSVTLPLKRSWVIIATRVGGSWIAALGILLAGWIIRYGAAIHT